MDLIHLEDRAVLAVGGAGARPFLQGLLTQDVNRLAPGLGLYAALLTPQGKIACDLFLVEGDGAILLDVAAIHAAALLKKLTFYRLRAPVSIEARPQLGVFAGPAMPQGLGFADPRLAQLGPRGIAARAALAGVQNGAAAYRARRLGLGVPEGAELDGIFALDAGLGELNGVAFAKGCYVGQELTARMHHRATARKRILTVAADGALPPPGTEISAGAQALGEILATYGAEGFALIRMDRLAVMHAGPVAGEIPVALRVPKWLESQV